jgi:hypothetical protein
MTAPRNTPHLPQSADMAPPDAPSADLPAPPAPPPPPPPPPVPAPAPDPAPARDASEHASRERPLHAYSLLGGHSFEALRSEPPPRLFATWWLRYLLALSQLVGIAVVLLREYAVPGGMDALFVVVPHVMAAVMLVGWSAFAMLDAARLVPATRYRRQSRAWVAIVLWIGAFVAPLAAVAIVDELRRRSSDGTEDLVAVAVGVVGMLVCFVLVWLPFRYHVRQAHRIGAPVRVVAAWFWLPLFAAVGVLAAMALGLHDVLADGGFTDLERTIQVAVLYGVPALMFAMSTWRATTVFDEVIELRWMRWRTEWEQTLVAFAAQPPPGPEASPVIDHRSS